jgi:23S rRNA pseudouridine1911/1915/1917 synthase
MGISAAPYIVAHAPHYAVLYKPPGMHTAPLQKDEKGTLLAWAAALFPETLAVRGKKEVEGGLLHRLDFETRGLVLVARSQTFYDALAAQQAAGAFIKEYRAVVSPVRARLPGFPPPPSLALDSIWAGRSGALESGFRPYGRGRRAVRPVLAAADSTGGRVYRTELLSVLPGASAAENTRVCRLRLQSGFRHQIRCHLAWLGFPIVNDPLYGGPPSPLALELEAVSLRFTDPSGRPAAFHSRAEQRAVVRG